MLPVHDQNVSPVPDLYNGEIIAYQMRHYYKRLRDTGLKPSLSRKGNCDDNAVTDSFSGTLKVECLYLESTSVLRVAIDEYIDDYHH
ncbi:hypothetical protein RABR111495_12115 [Rahnella bruchi]